MSAAAVGRRCVGCGRGVPALFVQYSPGNIRLIKCDSCKVVADPYIECEIMIILVDLILLKPKAYRHLLFNVLNLDSSDNEGILLKSFLAYIMLESFRLSFLKSSRYDWESSRAFLLTIYTCWKVLNDAVLANFIYMLTLGLGMRFLLKLPPDLTRYRNSFLAIIISSYFKLFLITMMVWEFPMSVIYIIDILVLSSNVIALTVLTEQRIGRCFLLCLAAQAVKFGMNHLLLHLK